MTVKRSHQFASLNVSPYIVCLWRPSCVMTFHTFGVSFRYTVRYSLITCQCSHFTFHFIGLAWKYSVAAMRLCSNGLKTTANYVWQFGQKLSNTVLLNLLGSYYEKYFNSGSIITKLELFKYSWAILLGTFWFIHVNYWFTGQTWKYNVTIFFFNPKSLLSQRLLIYFRSR